MEEKFTKALVLGGQSLNNAPVASPQLLVTQLTYRSTRLVNLLSRSYWSGGGSTVSLFSILSSCVVVVVVHCSPFKLPLFRVLIAAAIHIATFMYVDPM